MDGGYTIISLKDTNLVTATPTVIVGIHAKLESHFRKAILLTDIVIDGVEKADRFVVFENSGGDYVGILYESITNAKTYLTITDEDSVTVNVTES